MTPELDVRSEIEVLLLKFSSSEVDEMGVQQGAISVNTQKFTLEEATQAIETYTQQKVLAELGELYHTPGDTDKVWNALCERIKQLSASVNNVRRLNKTI